MQVERVVLFLNPSCCCHYFSVSHQKQYAEACCEDES